MPEVIAAIREKLPDKPLQEITADDVVRATVQMIAQIPPMKPETINQLEELFKGLITGTNP